MRGRLPVRRTCFADTGAGPHYNEKFPSQAVRTHIERPYVLAHLRLFPFLECDSMVSDILSRRPERMSAKKGGAAARLQPKIFCFRLSPRNSLASLAQTRRGLFTAETKNFPLRGRPPTERAGSCTSNGLVSYMRCGPHVRCKRFAHTSAGPHREACLFLHARGSFVSRAPLY